MTCFPDKEKKADKGYSNPILNRMPLVVGLVFLIAIAVLNPASATDSSVNWTQISDLVDGVSGLMPAIGGLITNVISPLILLVVVGFLVGLFDSLLGGITNALSFGRR